MPAHRPPSRIWAEAICSRKAVFMEKPLTRTLEEGRELVGAARDAGSPSCRDRWFGSSRSLPRLTGSSSAVIWAIRPSLAFGEGESPRRDPASGSWTMPGPEAYCSTLRFMISTGFAGPLGRSRAYIRVPSERKGNRPDYALTLPARIRCDRPRRIHLDGPCGLSSDLRSLRQPRDDRTR